MAGTPAGGVKLVKTMTERYGSYDAWVQIMKERAAKGGKKSYPNKGFAGDRKRASELGTIGGRISRRGKNNENAL